MNRSKISAILLLVVCAIGTTDAHAFGRRRPRPRPVPTATATPTDPAYSYSSEELEGIQVVNEHRLSIGLGAVTKNNFISFQCLGHDNYMIQQDKPSHDGFVNRSTAIQKKLNAQRVGEVVAYNFQSPQGVLTAWLNSPAHKEVIEGQYFKRVGYSVRTNSSGKKYYTMIFSD